MYRQTVMSYLHFEYQNCFNLVQGLGPVQGYPTAGPAHQQPIGQGSGSSAASNSPRGAVNLKRGKIEHRGGLNYSGAAAKPRQKGWVHFSSGGGLGTLQLRQRVV